MRNVLKLLKFQESTFALRRSSISKSDSVSNTRQRTSTKYLITRFCLLERRLYSDSSNTLPYIHKKKIMHIEKFMSSYVQQTQYDFHFFFFSKATITTCESELSMKFTRDLIDHREETIQYSILDEKSIKFKPLYYVLFSLSLPPVNYGEKRVEIQKNCFEFF